MPLLPSGRSMHAPLVRFAIVAVIGAALLIPLVMMESLVSERSSLYDGVVHDISRTWGGSQHLSGPFLLIPFTERQLVTRQISERDAQGRMTPHEIKEEQEVLDYLVILPKTADFRGKLDPQERTRGIYRSLVYTADMTLNGSFTLPTREELERVAPALSGVDYAHAFVVMGLSYPNALRTVGPFRWNGDPLSAQPGTQPLDILKNGFRHPRASRAAQARLFLFPASRSQWQQRHPLHPRRRNHVHRSRFPMAASQLSGQCSPRLARSLRRRFLGCLEHSLSGTLLCQSRHARILVVLVQGLSRGRGSL